ncbi:MAG: hypothetical protein R2781_08880 [Flavobacteriaceae bacterium]
MKDLVTVLDFPVSGYGQQYGRRCSGTGFGVGDIGGQHPGQFILTYHGSEEDAELGVNALSDFYTNLVNPQQIYARVTNRIDPDDQRSCYSVVPVILKVEQLPPFLLDETYRLCVDESGNR